MPFSVATIADEVGKFPDARTNKNQTNKYRRYLGAKNCIKLFVLQTTPSRRRSSRRSDKTHVRSLRRAAAKNQSQMQRRNRRKRSIASNRNRSRLRYVSRHRVIDLRGQRQTVALEFAIHSERWRLKSRACARTGAQEWNEADDDQRERYDTQCVRHTNKQLFGHRPSPRSDRPNRRPIGHTKDPQARQHRRLNVDRQNRFLKCRSVTES
jgi:hypothetical protein